MYIFRIPTQPVPLYYLYHFCCRTIVYFSTAYAAMYSKLVLRIWLSGFRATGGELFVNLVVVMDGHRVLGV